MCDVCPDKLLRQHLSSQLTLVHFHCVGTFYFLSWRTQAVKTLPFLHPWCCLSLYAAPLLFHSLGFIHFFSSFLCQGKEGWRSVDWCVCDVRARGRWGSQTLICQHPALLPRFLSLGLVQSRALWAPQSIFPIPACLQLVSSDRWLLILPHGARVRHEPFSPHRVVKMNPLLEKHFWSLLSFSSTHPSHQNWATLYLRMVSGCL